MNKKCSDFVLRDILDKEQVCTFFQPIVSLKKGTIFAYESLVRGLRIDSTDLITPCELFHKAFAETTSVELDRLCRKKALQSFSQFKNKETAMMFMNINTSEIRTGDSQNPHISTITRQMGFDPKHIGLELIESKSHSPEELIEFVNHYRDSGFLIVIDDFGCEHSNLDRLIHIHPDIIKIDRSLISGIESDPYRQSILKSIQFLAQMTGALCLAEGVETIEEIQTCHLLGVDLFQGFAIAYPNPDLANLEIETLLRITEIQHSIKKACADSLRKRRRLTGDVNILADWLIRQISPEKRDSLEQVFLEFMAMNTEIECIYLLNFDGIQISDTILAPSFSSTNRPNLFMPSDIGTNHSYKLYYTCFEALKIHRYLTDVYLSLASGNLCRTLSVIIGNKTAEGYILCIDFLEERVRSRSS